MKQFFTALAANFVTIAVCVVLGVILLVGLAAAAGSRRPVSVPDSAILVINMDQPLVDAATRTAPVAVFDNALTTGPRSIPLRAATLAIRAAADDDRISGILLLGTAGGDGVSSGFAALREMRQALIDFRASRKPVLAYLVTPDVPTYYLASVADSITMDPFGSLVFPGLAAEQMFFSGMLEKYGIGVQVSRVGRFKSAVEPFTRPDMSAENRMQTSGFLADLWSEVKRGVGESRGIDTLLLQQQADLTGILLPGEALANRLIDRVAYFDAVLSDLQRISGIADAFDNIASDDLSDAALPQIQLGDYAPLAMAVNSLTRASQSIAIVYAQGDIVDGEGAPGQVGGDALSRVLRTVRSNNNIKAVVLRVNSPGGSVIASERIQRELSLINATRPVVVSMGSVAASGGYWISTASRRIYAEPNTITGSIGVFAVLPNVKGLANNHGITFDTVKTGRYADVLSITRPRSNAELAVIQRGIDQVYDAFIERVAAARQISADSVAAIAEGRVWSGEQALQLGLVDSLGGLQSAVDASARMAGITGDYDVREYPQMKSPIEMLTEYLENKPAPIAAGIKNAVAGKGLQPAAAALIGDLTRELELLASYNDPRGLYARMPYMLRIR